MYGVFLYVCMSVPETDPDSVGSSNSRDRLTSSADSDVDSSMSNQRDAIDGSADHAELSTSTDDETETGSSISFSRRNRVDARRQRGSRSLAPSPQSASNYVQRPLRSNGASAAATAAGKSPVLRDTSQSTNSRYFTAQCTDVARCMAV